MTNAEKFQSIFGRYATEIWALPEEEFLKWLNDEYYVVEKEYKHFKCHQCGRQYVAKVKPLWDKEFRIHEWFAKCPFCQTENYINDCYWR